MNKKVNTVIFILCATLFNILVTIASFVLLLILYAKLLMPVLPETSQSWAFPLIFIGSMAVAFVAYRYLLKFLLNKVEVEKYFDPLFVRKYKK